MTMRPPDKPGDFERMKWNTVPYNMSSKKITNNELEELFPENKDIPVDKIKTIEETDNFIFYGLNGWDLKAYKCKKCDELLMGPPKIVDDTSIRRGIPLSGRLGYDVYCANCNEYFFGSTHELSISPQKSIDLGL